jgi:tRNA 2-thiouridine synthesizing protein A
MAENEVNARLDLQGVLCPLNFVKAKLKLEEMEPGEILELILDDGEATTSVPRSLKNEGHQIIKIEKLDNIFRMLVQKSGKHD